MAKFTNDAAKDAQLAYYAACDKMFVCTTQPTTYAEASATYNLATVDLTPGNGNGDFVIADGDTNGRKLTVTQQLAASIDASGDAQHVALGLLGDTTLRLVTTCTLQALVIGGTVDIPTFKVEIADPT